jgi:hypothetical protein
MITLTAALILFPAQSVHPVTPTSLLDTQGRRATPIADPKTSGSVLIFVIDGCPIARNYSPEINRLQAKFAPQKLPIYLVFAEPGITKSTVNALKKDFKLQPTAIINRELALQAQIKAVPTAVLYDHQGHIRYQGRIDDRFPTLGVQRAPRRADLQIAIEEYLAGKPITVPKTTAIGCLLPN